MYSEMRVAVRLVRGPVVANEGRLRLSGTEFTDNFNLSS